MIRKPKKALSFDKSSTLSRKWKVALLIFLACGYFVAAYFPDLLNASKVQGWFPAAGVAFLIGILFGWPGFLIILAVGILTKLFIGPVSLDPLTLINLFLLTLSITLLPKFLFKRNHIDPALSTSRDLNFFLVTVVFVSFVGGSIQIFTIPDSIITNSTNLWAGLLYYSLQISIGILTIFPIAVLLFAHLFNIHFGEGNAKGGFFGMVKLKFPPWPKIIEFILVLVTFIVITIIVFKIPGLNTLNSYYLFFIPLLWLSIRFNQFSAILGVLIVTAGIMTAVRLVIPTMVNILNMQLFLFVQAAATIITSHFVGKQREVERDITSSELLFRSFINNLPDPAWLKDVSGKYLAINQANCDLYGLSADDFYNKMDEQIFSLDKAREFMVSDHYVIDNMLPVRFEADVTTANNETIWHEVVKTPILQNGQVIGTTGIARDITDRKQTETAMLESELRLKALLNNIPDMAWLKDMRDRFIAVNDVFCTTYNFNRDDILGKTTTELFPAELAEKFLLDDHEVITIGRPKVIEEEVTNTSGYSSWYETVKMPIFNDKKEIVGVTGIAREITNRKRAEESLQQRLSLEAVITTIASSLNQFKSESLEHDLQTMLQDVAKYLIVDRCTLTTLDENYMAADIRVQWTDKNVPNREMIVLTPDWFTYKWLKASVEHKETIKCSRIVDLPANADAEMEFWLKNGIVSMLAVPSYSNEHSTKALMTAETILHEKVWTTEEVQFFQIIGEMILTTIARLENDKKLKQAEHRYRLLAEQIAAVVYIEAPDHIGQISYISPQVEELTGYTPEEWLRPPSLWQKIIHPDDKKIIIKKEQLSLRTRTDFREEYRLITKSGNVIWLEDQMSFMPEEGGEGVWHGVMYDITARKEIEKELSQSKVRYQELFNHSPVSLWEEDFSLVKKRINVIMKKCKNGIREYLRENPNEISKLLNLLKVIHVNQTTLTLMKKGSFDELSTIHNPTFNMKPTDLFIEEIVAISEGKTNFEVEAPNDVRDGIVRYHNLHFMVVPGYEKTFERVIIAITDITDRKLTEEKLTYLSTHDSLTGLFSRSFFETELNRLQDSRQYPISILMVDVDNLKITNDTEGHAAGDLLIRRTSQVLRLTFRPEDVVARIGGDEFAVIIPTADRFSAAKLTQRLRTMLEIENKNNPNLKAVSLSIGISTAETGDLLTDVLKTADYLMYQDKENKKKAKAGRVKSSID